MIVSTRGRYALRFMIDLAENAGNGYIPLKDVAKRQEISSKYLERILPELSENNLIVGHQGKNGGYRLSRRPEDYKIGEILRITECNELCTVACLEKNALPCRKSSNCRTLPFWRGLNKVISDYIDNVTLKDLLQENNSEEHQNK